MLYTITLLILQAELATEVIEGAWGLTPTTIYAFLVVILIVMGLMGWMTARFLYLEIKRLNTFISTELMQALDHSERVIDRANQKG